MGCQQSKGVEIRGTNSTKTTPPCSPVSTKSFGDVYLPSHIQQIADPGEQLYQLLLDVTSSSSNDNDNANSNNNPKDPANIWAQVVTMCEKEPRAAQYTDPDTLETPLHLACRAMHLPSAAAAAGAQQDATPADAVRALIRCDADSPSAVNQKGYVPLHYAIRSTRPSPSPSPSATTNTANDMEFAAGDNIANGTSYIHHQVQVISVLIAADYDASMEYLSRNEVTFNDLDGACTPLYHAVSAIPDDFAAPPGPTVDLISAIHFPNPTMVSAKNLSNYDKPLALLYRRFSRQFDLSEKFFPGDNSRKEVLDHRQHYKTAAMNTWKIILKLLDPLTTGTKDENGIIKPRSVSDFYIVHSAVKLDCPPDLIRYIIETRPGEVSERDDQGRLPLHIAAATNTKEFGSTHYHSKFMIDELLYAYPEGATVQDKNGILPIQLAVESGKSWIGGGMKSLYDVYPEAMTNVEMDDYPLIQKAMSFSSQFAEQQEADAMDDDDENDDGGDEDTTTTTNVMEGGHTSGGGVKKEEHYDAIMMVQKPDAELGSITSAMWANEEDGGVQMLGCMAITNLASQYSKKADRPKLYAIALSSVTTIVNSMKNHPNEPAVQEQACKALVALASADNHREVSFTASGAAASIVGAMQAHVSDAIVQQEACCALYNIVKHGGATRATVIASVSGFTALQNALGAHPESVGVQREACLALEALTVFPDANLPDLPGVQTAPLLEAAAYRFPDECKETAVSVLSRLS